MRSLWWDLHEEEFESKSIATTSGADFATCAMARTKVYSSALRHFGLSESDIVERAEKYERVRRSTRQTGSQVAALDISDANVERPHSSLCSTDASPRTSRRAWQSPSRLRARRLSVGSSKIDLEDILRGRQASMPN